MSQRSSSCRKYYSKWRLPGSKIMKIQSLRCRREWQSLKLRI